MNSSIELLHRLSEHWWDYVVQTGWQAALVGALLLVVVHGVGRRWRAPLRYALLVLALLKFGCPPLLPIPTGVVSPLVAPRIILSRSNERKPAPVTAPAAAAPGTRASADGRGLALTSLMVLHLMGAIAVAGLIVARALRLRRMVCASWARLGGPLHEQYRDLAIQLGVLPIPPLVISERAEAPMAFALSKRVIVLPAAVVEGLSPGELRAVLAHELAHCQRGDLWLNWVQLLLLVVWWFHPVLWLVNRSLREVREDCCDDLLLGRGLVTNDAYCDALLRVAAELSPARSLEHALGFANHLHPLGRRMARITDWTVQRYEDVSIGSAAVILILAAVLLPGVGESTEGRKTGLTVQPAVARLGSGGFVTDLPLVVPTSPQEPGGPATAPGTVPEHPTGPTRPQMPPATIPVQKPDFAAVARVPVRCIAPPAPVQPGSIVTRIRPAGVWSFIPGVLRAPDPRFVQRTAPFSGRGSFRLPPTFARPGLVASGGVWVDRLPWSGQPGWLPPGLPRRVVVLSWAR